jgi:predicted TPR repeat methyltransferase
LYSESYKTGYNYYQWECREKKLLTDTLIALRDQGCSEYLDFACGTGRILQVAETIYGSTTGVDVSETMLAQAKAQIVDSALICQDLTKTGLEKKFDIVTAFRFFNNAEDELKIDVLNALKNQLTENGKLVFNIHRSSNGFLHTISKIRNRSDFSKENPYVGLNEITKLVEDAGFEIEHVNWYSLLPKLSRYPGWFMKMWFRYLDPILTSSLSPLARKSQCFLIVASKKS